MDHLRRILQQVAPILTGVPFYLSNSSVVYVYSKFLAKYKGSYGKFVELLSWAYFHRFKILSRPILFNFHKNIVTVSSPEDWCIYNMQEYTHAGKVGYEMNELPKVLVILGDIRRLKILMEQFRITPRLASFAIEHKKFKMFDLIAQYGDIPPECLKWEEIDSFDEDKPPGLVMEYQHCYGCLKIFAEAIDKSNTNDVFSVKQNSRYLMLYKNGVFQAQIFEPDTKLPTFTFDGSGADYKYLLSKPNYLYIKHVDQFAKYGKLIWTHRIIPRDSVGKTAIKLLIDNNERLVERICEIFEDNEEIVKLLKLN